MGPLGETASQIGKCCFFSWAVMVLSLLYLASVILLRVLRQIKGVIHSFVELLIEAVLCVQCCCTAASRTIAHSSTMFHASSAPFARILSLYHSATSFSSSVPNTKDKFIPSSKAGCHCRHRNTQRTQFIFHGKDRDYFSSHSTMDIGQDRH